MVKIRSFIFFQEWEEFFKMLSPQERSDLIMAIFEYARNGAEPKKLTSGAMMAFISIRNAINLSWSKFVARSNGDYE